ncbi:MAG: MdtA/MuxA family multidrug efflux RND transporter periplasmic adaptor subunit [Candidatus Binataceae bacterium]
MRPNTPATEQLEAMYSGKEEASGIRTATPGLRWQVWLAAALILGAAAYLLLSRTGGARTADAVPALAHQGVPVAAVQAKVGDLNRYLTALGSVTPFNTVTVKSRVDGQLMKVDFTEGQLVHEGDLIAEIDPRPFQVQLAQAEGQLARDQASLVNAKVTAERDRVLFAHDAIAQQDLDNQQSTAGQYEGAVVSDKASIDNAKLQLIYSRITAPLTGRIGLRLIDPGNIVHATDTQGLAVITQLQPIAVLFSIPEDDLPRVLSDLKRGSQLPVDAYDRDLTKKLATGWLLTFDNQIDPGTGTIRLKASFPNYDNSLFPNQFVNVKLLVDTIRNAVLIPAAAVQRSSLDAFVFVVRADQTVDVRNVKIGAIQDETASISAGLKPGELVVTDGLDKLQQGARVRFQSAANASAQKDGQ